ncbi:MAG: tRNA (N(6)-L-threonylcarbamoyladenosine(37)-C(2))-methylthiotransferase MtaB [Lachnospiraceae bacterium]|nr:tRNA (N(6)-L-threonylcarbamoyladenosine(37)-C(2))-methylthiotransferase MtaB [Lachnospiraceae bacterium]
MRKAAFHTLGCKVNSYETEAMQEMLQKAGYEIVPFEEAADVYVVNTCSVTNIADRKSRQMLHRAKKRNPQAVVVAAGCYVQEAPEEVKKDEAVDLIIGNNRKKDLVSLLEEYFAGQEADAVVDLVKPCEYEELTIHTVAERTRAYVKIQDGCNQFCSYCIIPYTRGRIRSRQPEDVLEEVKRLAASGRKEIVLTGIHLSSYGVDLGEEIRLLDLIRMIHPIEGIERIRLGSLEPGIITEDFAYNLKQMDKVCPHFHLSLQSGCKETLKRMNRKYTPEEYYEKCEILRRVYGNPAITTDVIVGFPGETEEEFQTTKAFLEKVHFFEMHIFKYSRRRGTKADRMDNQIPEQVKGVRSDELLALEKQMSEEYRQSLVGRTVQVLLEEEIEIGSEKRMVGHTPEYVRCAVKTQKEANEIVTAVCSGLYHGEVLLAE